MIRDAVLFRVDGARATGWEALARCQVFANALQRRRRPSHFLGKLEPATLVATVKRGDNEWLNAEAPVGSAEDLDQMTRAIRRLRPAAVIVDAPTCGPDYLAELVALGPLVVAFDHVGDYRFPAQLVVHPGVSKCHADYDVTPSSQVLAGQRYTLVRPGVRRMRLVRGQEPPEPFRAVVGFGDDPHDLTSRMVKLLLGMPQLSRVDILARTAHPALPKWQALAEAHKGRVTVATETTDQARRISRAHLALTEGNSLAFELACVGVPSLCIVQNEAYWTNAQRLEEEGASTHLGWFEAVTDKTIRQAVENLLEDPGERRLMSRCGRGFIDGRGPDRLVTALEIMLYPMRNRGADFRAAA
jgi:spore coat polysaccharide biosynthesis predicted glycosyltransferase SpsG